jgi:hypothetical protein
MTCDCHLQRRHPDPHRRFTPEWRVRKEAEELFAWRIWHYSLSSLTYEHVMRCSTWDGAMALIDQFVWLRKNAMTGETHV